MKRWHVLLLLLVGCGHREEAPQPDPDPDPAPVGTRTFRVSSESFEKDGEIPASHTCDGEDSSPSLDWAEPPQGIKSYVLIVDDPDAPKRTWVHWVVMDLPPGIVKLPAGGPLPAGAIVGKNDFGKEAWGGPCPPSGRHHYHFKVYGLDTKIGKPGATKADVIAAMKDHILARGELVGTYQKK